MSTILKITIYQVKQFQFFVKKVLQKITPETHVTCYPATNEKLAYMKMFNSNYKSLVKIILRSGFDEFYCPNELSFGINCKKFSKLINKFNSSIYQKITLLINHANNDILQIIFHNGKPNDIITLKLKITPSSTDLSLDLPKKRINKKILISTKWFHDQIKKINKISNYCDFVCTNNKFTLMTPTLIMSPN